MEWVEPRAVEWLAPPITAASRSSPAEEKGGARLPEYRRWYVVRGTYFFTLVTWIRRPILCSDLAYGACTRRSRPSNGTGHSRWSPWCPLADHLHTVWTLPRGDVRYPVRWKRIKQEFTRRYLKAGREEVPPSRSRVRHAEPGIWQRRYWEHTIEDEDDLKRCVDDRTGTPRSTGT